MDTTPSPTGRVAARASIWALLVTAAVAAILVVAVSYGFNVEYGDTGATAGRTALRALTGSSGVAIVIVGTLAVSAALVGRRSRVVRALAVLVLAVTVAGVPLGAVLGTQAKYDRLPDVPSCTSEFTGGPALPVVRAAQAAFEEIGHPAPFSGGGSSGIDGCSSELMVRHGVDPRPSYREELRAHGWLVTEDEADRVTATRDGQGFELTRDGGWWVWIGPAGLEEQDLEDGQFGPRG